MSYLPRMSKTYKEPQQNQLEEPEANSSDFSLKPASSLLAEGTYNPQIALKHYRYLPHPLPVLPGPSLFEQVEENELQREASRLKRSNSKMEGPSKVNHVSGETLIPEIKETNSSCEAPEKSSERVLSRPQSKKSIKGHFGRKKSAKLLKKEKTSEIAINVGDTGRSQLETNNRDKTFDSKVLGKYENRLHTKNKSNFSVANQDLNLSSPIPKTYSAKLSEKQQTEVMSKEHTNRSVQCAIFGSPEKTFVIPLVIHSLLRSLALLLREFHREDVLSSASGERRTLMTQIQLILGDLCNQNIGDEYGFDVTYSDSKRLEKILGEFQKYMKDVYGDKEEYVDKMEDLKKVFIELKKKELEVDILTSKLNYLEGQPQPELILTESDLRNPEITLQNKRLESEQLLAEMQFGCRELLKFQKTIAEIEWDVRNSQEEIAGLKKSASKSKSEVLGRKFSLHKLSSDITAKGIKSKESDVNVKKKT